MATEAEGYRDDFDDALTQYGQWVWHRRAPYTSGGVAVSGFRRPLRILDLIPATLMGSRWSAVGLNNLANPDDRDTYYCSGRSDIQESDTIELRSGKRWVYNLTLVKPFVVSDTVIFYVMTAFREREARR